MYDTFTLNDIAKDLRKSKRSVLRLAKSGSLPVITTPRKSGFAYVVPVQSYFAWKNQKANSKTQNKQLSDLSYLQSLENDWIEWCRKGLLTGKPFSEVTINNYKKYLSYYWARLPRRYSKISLISFELVREVVGNIDPKSHSQKVSTLNAVKSFVKYLITKKLIDSSILAELRQIKPRRVYPPKRLHCTLEQFNLLLAEAAKERSNNDVILNNALVSVLGFAGLRATELCNLRVQDVDLVNRTLFVCLGKGKKNRTVGICKRLYEALENYLKVRPKIDLENLFLAKSYKAHGFVPFTRDVLWRKIKRLSKRAGVNVNVHGLRRTFATIAANSGKPINIISLALGHADLKTTQGYLMTTQDEVIKEMQGW